MTDFGRYVREGGEIKLAASAEFVSSPAVLPAFQSVYDFELDQNQLLKPSKLLNTWRGGPIIPTRPSTLQPKVSSSVSRSMAFAD